MSIINNTNWLLTGWRKGAKLGFRRFENSEELEMSKDVEKFLTWKRDGGKLNSGLEKRPSETIQTKIVEKKRLTKYQVDVKLNIRQLKQARA